MVYFLCVSFPAKFLMIIPIKVLVNATTVETPKENATFTNSENSYALFLIKTLNRERLKHDNPNIPKIAKDIHNF